MKKTNKKVNTEVKTVVNKEEAFKLTNLAYKLAKNSYEIEKDDFLYKTSTETHDDIIIFRNEKNTSWEILLDSENNSKGYKAVAFLNNETKEVHIATAGTIITDINDLWDDALITFGFVPRKITPMKIFVEDVIKKLGNDSSSYKFSTSGHSLGAVMSDLTAAEIISRGLEFDKSITFENPGSKKVIETAISNKVFSGTKDVVIKEISKQCVEYNAKPNFINTMGNHLSKNINLVLQDNQETETSNPEPINSSSSGLFGFGKYIYNKVGSVVNKCSEKLGITSVINQIEEHSLKNFKDIDLSLTYKVSDYGNGKPKLDKSEIDRLKNTPSTGNDIQYHYEVKLPNDFTGLFLKEYSYKDLAGADGFEILGANNDDSFEILGANNDDSFEIL
jgi:hypothetical protein